MRILSLLVSFCLASVVWAPAAEAVPDSRPVSPASATQTSPELRLIPPVDAPITRGFEGPASPYGPGHRGIDYGVAAGALVRSAGEGTVTFAGPVAASVAVTVQHSGGLETTYSILSDVLVSPGERVSAGTWLGHTAISHAQQVDGLHFGVKVDNVYVDPELFLGPLDVGDALHLAPLDAGSTRDDLGRPCRRQPHVIRAARPPNGNIAVTIAGIGSKSAGIAPGRLRAVPPELLGYRRRAVYRFSYSGTRGPRWHRPYEVSDTQGDLRIAARRLAALLRRIGKDHPGRAVDLIAHSQGGIVARLYLEHRAAEWDPSLPAVEHLVTFATPHGGAPLAGQVAAVRDGTVTGRAVLAGTSWLARKKGWGLDPRARAVAQLAPQSPLMGGLAREDVLFGSRVLALGAATDVIVPADAARYPGEESRTLAPAGLDAHGAIRLDPTALGLAYAWLRDAPLPCPDGWDRFGESSGALISWLERHVGWAYGAGEDGLFRLRWARAAGGVLARGARWAGRGVATVGRAVGAAGSALWGTVRSAGSWASSHLAAAGRLGGRALNAGARAAGRAWSRVAEVGAAVGRGLWP